MSLTLNAAVRDETPETAPLCVDLDGTLVKSDTLVDSLLVLARTQPLKALRLPAMLLKGKAAFKAFVTDHVRLDVSTLPYNRALLHFLQQEQQRGRQIYLATGADARLAERVAAHLELFAGVVGSDGATNLTGKKKLELLRNRFAGAPFDYAGNDSVDMPLLAASREAIVANPTAGLRRGLKRAGLTPAHIFLERRPTLSAFLKAIRPHQWAKNVLLFLPLLLAHTLRPELVATELLAFFCLSLVASATYIVNDLLDIEADRRHVRKRWRPFASGDLSATAGAAIAALFMVAAASGAMLLPRRFVLWLGLYLVVTLAYSLYLKRVALVDVLVLSSLYTLRILAGGAALHVWISHWLSGFSSFFFLSLAFVKRFAELESLRSSGLQPRNGRGYVVTDIEQIRAFGTSSAFAAVVVFANYVSSRDVARYYRNPSMLWMVLPLLILWLSRVWLLASRGELDEDPVLFALTDKLSLALGAAVALVAALAI